MQRIEIVGRLAELAHRVAVGGMTPDGLLAALRALAVEVEKVATGGGQPAVAASSSSRAIATTTMGTSAALAMGDAAVGALASAVYAAAEMNERSVRLDEAVDRIFAFWLSATGRSAATTRKTPERTSKIKARLRDGYTERDIRRAIANVAQSEFHQGAKGTRYDDITLICRNGSYLEKYRDMSDEEPTDADASAATASYDEQREQQRAKLKKKIAKAMKEGRKDEYEKLQDRLRQLDATP